MSMSEGPVLVVEDDPEVNELVCAYAEIAGFPYESALNGTVALEKAREHVPALVLLDVMLPDLDGFEVCRRLKAEQRTQGVPVVMLTALDREEYRQRGCQCGAIAYLTKPFNPDHLVDIIRRTARNGSHPGEEQPVVKAQFNGPDLAVPDKPEIREKTASPDP